MSGRGGEAGGREEAPAQAQGRGIGLGIGVPPGGRPFDAELALRAADGVRLRGAFWRPAPTREGAPRGLALLLPGRVEFVEKYALPAARLVERGFAAASLDWRGQGLSERRVRQGLKGHVDDFREYHRDLAALIAHPLVAAVPGPRLVIAHSMGGLIALGALLRGRLSAEAVVLSAPMLGILFSPRERMLARLLLPLARLPGFARAWPPVRGRAVPYALTGFEGNLLTDDRELFEWGVGALAREPRLALALPTIGWLAAARREQAWVMHRARIGDAALPPTLCLLGAEEAVVDAAAVRAAARGFGFRLVVVPGARHELLFAAEPARRAVWQAIDAFLAKRGL